MTIKNFSPESHKSPRISVVTPSYNHLEYLKCCVSSVKDQDIRGVEHIVMDGGSTDGTVEWLAAQDGLCCASKRDNGMYDALNEGFARAKGEIFAYLNCDEQYLPGTLQFVDKFFTAHPEVDVLFGDFLLIRPDGTHVAYRKGIPLRWSYVLSSHLYLFSCTMFFRSQVFKEGLRFDISYRSIADLAFVVDLLQKRYRCAHISRYLAAFTITGKNMSASKESLEERLRYDGGIPKWVRALKPFLNGARLAEKALRGCYHQRAPLTYSVFTSEQTGCRTEFSVRRPSFRWRFM